MEMKLSAMVLCICCVLGCAIGCGEPPAQAPAVDEVQGALAESCYSTAITYPNLNNRQPPAFAMAYGNEWWQAWNGGWMDHQSSPSDPEQTYRTGPSFSWPVRASVLSYFRSDHQGMASAAAFEGGYLFNMGGDGACRRQVMIGVWDKRFPWSTGTLANKWTFQAPLKATSTSLDGRITFYIPDVSQGAAHNPNVYPDRSLHVNDPDNGFQIASLVMDKYARCKVCNHHDLTGSCHWFGYNCPDQSQAQGATCSPTIYNQDTTTARDIRQWTQDANGNPTADASIECEYGVGMWSESPPTAFFPNY